MQTWAKRGIQSAFVTGGLLMLGTGIASAQENVNPDAAPPVVDAGATVPVKIDQNNLATPVKQLNVPKVDRTISTDRVTSVAPTRTAAPVAHPLVRTVSDRVQGTALSSIARGNTIQAHVDVPINICGNQISVLADGSTTADCEQSSHRDGSITTTGAGQALAGNIVAVNHVLPVQITGNAIAAGGNAATDTTATQEATTGGDLTTNGDKGAISGNVVAEQGATPVQITGNGVGAAGIADVLSTADTKADSSGVIETSGKDSSVSGNVAQIPLAPLFEVNGNSAAGAGNAATDSTQSGTAVAGDKVATNGDPATLAGNVAKTPLAGPITVDDNAAAAGGNSYATSDTTNESTAGGDTNTSGHGSTAAGNVADTPISLPVAAGGNAASLIGNSGTDHSNTVDSVAGGDSYTLGDNGVLSGNLANVPPATAVDVCGNGAAGGGQASGTCVNDVKSETGGYQGTFGDNSVASGNIAQTPLAAPAEVFGLAAAAAGTAAGSADETKDVRSSGQPNTEDDHGTVSSNIVTAPTAVAAQVFGDTAGVVGNTTTDTANDTTVTAGQPPHATGKKGSVSGNIVQAPSTTPAQVFGVAATLVGNNSAVADNATDMKAGGDALTSGEQGSVAGNVVSAPVATGTQVLGWTVGGAGNVDSATTNDLSSVAGGDVNSNGDGGSVSGNLIGAQPAVLPAVPGNTVSAAGITNSDVVSSTNVVSGADSYSTADDASVSGNLIHVPATAVAGVYADAVAAAGNATTATDKTSNTVAGGEMLTEGSGPLTAREMTVPVEAAANVARIPVEVVGQAITTGTSDDTQLTGEDAGTLRATQLKGIELPKGIDKLMGATEVPAFNGVDSLSASSLPVNALPSTEGLTAMAGQLPLGSLPAAPALPIAQERSNLPLGPNGVASVTPNVQGLPVSGLLEAAKGLVPAGATQRSLPSLPVALPALPSLPIGLPVPTERALPAVPAVPAVPADISGLNLNPTSGLVPAGERSLPSLPMVPAISALDTAKVFETVTGTL